MTPNNNFSVLPFYESLSEQDSRRWWQYGKKYPLFVDRVRFIPFQIIREHTPELLHYSSYQSGRYIDEQGNIEQWAVNIQSVVLTYTGFSGGETIYLFKVATPRERGVIAAAYDSSNSCLEVFNPSASGIYTGAWTLPAGTAKVSVYAYDPLVSERNGGITLDIDSVAQLRAMEFYTNNEAVDHYEDDSDILASYALTFGDYDVIVFTGRSAGAERWPVGLHYISVHDGYRRYYSDFFTCVEDMAQYIKLEWWDNEDFVMDAGRIVYQPAEGVEYHNIAYLKAEIAKPEYTFEEDVERRDGYDYPTKQISAKTYRFSFFATEFLLDALRFVRMSDHIVITDGEKVYNPSAFLITPEWEKEGDVAGVEAQFQTDTIAKKIGLAYIRPQY